MRYGVDKIQKKKKGQFDRIFPVEADVNDGSLPPQAAFRLGLSHPPLALAALDALEEWSSGLSRDLMQPYYREVLPCLDYYLKTAAANGGALQLITLFWAYVA